MADGREIAIKDVRVGDFVLGCSTSGVVRPVRVLDVFETGTKPCTTYTFRNGTGRATREGLLEVTCTPEHKILSEHVIRVGAIEKRKNRFVSIRPIGTVLPSKHDRFCATLSSSYDDSGLVDEPRAALLGALIGDGCYTGGLTSNGIGLSCRDTSRIDDLKKSVEGLGYNFVAQSTEGEYRITDSDRFNMKTATDGRKYRNGLSQWLRELGIWGQCSYEKCIPDAAFGWNNRSVAALLGGLIATDGHILAGHATVGFGSTSKKLVEQYKLLLRVRFGINTCSIRGSTTINKVTGLPYKPHYATLVSRRADVEKIMELIPIPGIKSSRLRAVLEKFKVKSHRNVSGRCMLVSAVDVGTKKTYDLHVDHPDHLFLLANGLVVSNSEPITQGSLNAKHKGGVSGNISGFDAIDQFIDAPSESPSWATHASRDGLVTSIRPHPAGGNIINVDGEEHYAYPHAVITAQQGDKVEAGDMLTDGLPNPNEFMKHKGIGEGRRLFTHALHRLLKENGTPASRRHIELVAKGMANHVRFNDEHQEWLPNDVVPYDRVEASWNPRPDAKSQTPKQAIGSYLESPVLHYSIGTRVTPKVSAELSAFNVPSVITHHSSPPFEPEYVSGRETLMHDPDWQTRMAGSYLQKSTLDAARTGAVSDEAGTSFVPALALGTGFGTYGSTKQPNKPS